MRTFFSLHRYTAFRTTLRYAHSRRRFRRHRRARSHGHAFRYRLSSFSALLFTVRASSLSPT